MTLSTHFWAIFYQTFNLTMVKKIPKNCKNYWWIIDTCNCLRNYSTKPSYIFQIKRELKVWKYIFNIFHFEMLIQKRNPKFRPLCLFVLTFVFVCFDFSWIRGPFCVWFYKLSLFIFFVCFLCQVVLFMCCNQYKLNNSSDPR